MANNKYVKDIKTRMKQSANTLQKNTPKVKSGIIQYGTNVSKSLLYSGRDAITKGLLPNLFETIEINKSIISDISDSVKNPSLLGSKFRIIDDDVSKELRELSKNALDDIKTGKFYDSKRDRSSFGAETAALLDGFGGFDMDGFDDDGEYSTESSDTDELIKSNVDIAELQEDNADNRAKATISAMGSVANALIDSNQAIHKSDLKVRMSQHAQTMTGIGNLLTTNATMLDTQVAAFNNLSSQVNTMAQIMSDKLDNIVGVLTEIRDQGSGASKAPQRSAYQSHDLPMNNRGILDIKKYVKMVTKNADNTFGISNSISLMTMGMSPKDLIDMYKSNPLQFVVDRTISSIIPTTTKQISEQLNKSIGGFFSSLLLKFNNSKDKDGAWGFLGKIFGMNITSEKDLKLSEYNKGEIKLNGRMEKAIVEVIPTYLRQILEALSGNKAKVMNYDTGVFEDAFKNIESYQKQLVDLTRHMGNTTSAFSRRVNSMNFANTESKDILDRDINNFIQAVAEKGVYFDPRFKKDSLGVNFEGRQSEEMIRAMLKRMKRSDLHKMNQEIVSAHRSRNENTYRLQDQMQASGMSALYNGADDDYSKARDDYGKGVKYNDKHMKQINDSVKGLGATNRILGDIFDVLKRGIVVFNSGSKGSNSSAANEAFSQSAETMKKFQTIRSDLSNDLIEESRRKSEQRLRGDLGFIKNGLPMYDSEGNLSAEMMSAMIKAADMQADKKEKDAIKAQKENSLSYRFMEKNFGKKNSNGDSLFNSIQTAMNNPFKLVNDAMISMDRALFKVIYGDSADDFLDDDEFSTNKASGLFGHISNMLSGSMMKLGDVFKKVVWDDESVLRRNYIKGRDWVEGKVKGAGKRGFDYFANPMKDGFSRQAEIAEMIARGEDPGLNFRQKIGYEAGKLKGNVKIDKNFFGDIKSSFKNAGRSSAFIKGGLIDQKDLTAGQQLGYKSGLAFDKMMTDVRSFFLGDDIVNEDGTISKTRSKKLWEQTAGEFKGFLPKGLVYGAAGGVGSMAGGLLTGMFLPGGPIMGALLGSTIGFVSHSEKFKTYLFGNEEQNKEGVIDKQVVAGFKKYFPKIAIGTGIGATITNLGLFGTTFLPGGPIMGALLGSMGGMISASDELKKLMFGEEADADSGLMSKNFRKSFLHKLGMGVGGFAVGKLALGTLSQFGILGSLVMPGGPILGPMMLGLGAAFSADHIKEYFFGNDKVDDKGNKINKGVFAGMYDFAKGELFDPFIGWINKSGNSISKWFEESVVGSLREGMQPFKDEMSKNKKAIGEAVGNIGTYMKDGISSVFTEVLGRPLGEIIKDNLTDPLKNVLSVLSGAVGRFVGSIISSPFRLINAIGTGAPMFEDERGKRRSERRLDRKYRKDERTKARQSRQNSFTSWMSNFLSGGRINVSNLPTNAIEAITSEFALSTGISDPEALGADNSRDFTGATRTNQSLSERNRARRDARRREELDKATTRAEKRRIKNQHKREDSEADIQVRMRRAEAAGMERESARDGKYMDERTDGKSESDFYRTKKFRTSFLNMNKNIMSIKDEIKGQLNGVGYNLAYIRNILLKHLGADGVDTPESEEKRGYRLPKSKLGRLLHGLRSGISGGLTNAKDSVLDFFSSKFGFVMKPIDFFKNIFLGMFDAAAATKDFALAIGKTFTGAFKLILPGLQAGFTEVMGGIGTAFRLTVEGVGNTLLGVTDLFRELSGSFGTLAGQIVTSLGDTMNILTAGAKAFAVTSFELLSTIGVDVAKGAWRGLKGLAGTTVGAVGFGLTSLFKGRAEAIKTKSKYLGKVFVEGGELGVRGLEMADTSGKISPLKTVSLLFGKLIGKLPTKALPVYIMNPTLATASMTPTPQYDSNGDLIPGTDQVPESAVQAIAQATGKGASQAKSISKNFGIDAPKSIIKNPDDESLDLSSAAIGAVLTDAILDAEEAKAEQSKSKVSRGFKTFKSEFNKNYRELKDSRDIDKVTNKLVNRANTQEQLDSTRVLMEKESLNSLNDIKHSLGGGNGKNGGGGFAGLTSLLSGIVPILGSIMSLLGGDWERLGVNLFRAVPSLNKMVNSAGSNLWKSLVKVGSKAKTLGGKVGNWIRKDLGYHTIAEVGEEGVERMSMEAVEKYAGKAMSKTAKVALAKEISQSAVSNLGVKTATRSINSLAKKSVASLVKDAGGKQVTVAAVKKGASKLAVEGATEVVQKGIVGQIGSKLKNFLLSKAMLEKVGGSKMVGVMSKFADDLIKQLAKNSAKGMAKGVASKIIAKLGGPVFLIYDFTTGMLEVGNIFHIDDKSASWGMRVTAGLSKMISGILFGLIPDDFIVELAFGIFGSAEEQAQVEQSRAEFEQARLAYNAEHGTNLSADQYNDDIANQRVASKVWGGIKSGWNATTGFIGNMGKGISKGWNGMVSGVSSGLSYAGNATGKFLGNAAKGIGTGFSNAGKFLGGVGSGIAGGLSSAWGGVKQFATDYDFRIGMIDTIGNGIKSAIGGVADILTKPFKGLTKTFDDLTLFFTEGFWAGLSQLGKNLLNTTSDVMFGWMKPIWKGVAKLFGWDVGEIIEKPGDAVVNTVSNGLSGVGTWFKGLLKNKSKTDTTNVSGTARGFGRGSSSNSKLEAAISNSSKDSGDPILQNVFANLFGRGGAKSVRNAFSVVNNSEKADLKKPTKSENGIYHYKQDDPRWGLLKYGEKDTMKTSGCAPTVAATVISNYNQKNPVSPVDTAKFADENGYKLKNDGTDIKYFIAIGRKYGLKIVTGVKSPELIMTQLKLNKPVIVMGSRTSKDSGYVGVGMHYMVLTAYDENRKQVVINDPSSSGMRYASLNSVLKDTRSVLFTESNSKGMQAKYVSDKKAGTATSGTVKQGVLGKVTTNTKEFIEKIKAGAIDGYSKYGVLPSLTIAQAILESGSGKYAIGNNIFGIKAFSSWKGLKQLVPTTEYVNGTKIKVPAFFRDYGSIAESIADHAKLLTGKRYSGVISAGDYKSAAQAVQQAGYATDPAYASKLINIIEKYGLGNIDMQARGGRGGATGAGTGTKVPKLLDGMMYYGQSDYASSSDIYKNGCGAVAASIVISSYGKTLIPADAFAFAKSKGFMQKDKSITAEFFPAIGKKYGVNFYIGVNKIETVRAQLTDNKPVILLGKTTAKKNLFGMLVKYGNDPWNETPHYLVLSSYNKKNNTVYIVDPLGKSTGNFNLNEVMKGVSRVIYSNVGGHGIYRSDNNKRIKYMQMGDFYKNGGIASTATSTVKAGAGVKTGSYDQSSDGYGTEDIAATSTKKLDLYGMINKIFGAFEAGVDIKYGTKTFAQAYADLNNMTEEEAVVANTVGGGKKGAMYSNIKGLLSGDTDIHDFFGQRLEALARDKGKKINLTSGMRTKNEQLVLWNNRDKTLDYKASDGSLLNRKVANPNIGLSYHQFGMAADTNTNWLKKMTNSELKPYGLHKPIIDIEDWHIQPTETSLYKTSKEMSDIYGLPSGSVATVPRQYSTADKNVGDATTGTLADPIYASVKKMNSTINGIRNQSNGQELAKAEAMMKAMSGTSSDNGIILLLKEMINVLKSIDSKTVKGSPSSNDSNETATTTSQTPVVKNTGGKSIAQVTAGTRIIDSMTRA